MSEAERPGPLQGHLHGAVAAIAVFGWRGDVEGVAGKAIALNFAINLGAARLGMLEFFQHDHAGALAHHKAIAVLVIRPRCLLRRVVEAGGERAAGIEAGNADAADGGFRAARQHHIGVIQAISRAASPMACAPVAQAVTTAWLGPL